MKNPREYTLGEIETLVSVCQVSPTVQAETLIALSTLVRHMVSIIREQQNYRVTLVTEEISKPRPVTHRREKSLDDDLLNSCVIVGL